MKQIIFNNYATNLKTILSHRSLRISGLLTLYFLFCILVDTIDNIITYSPYSPYYVTRTSANGSTVLYIICTLLYHVTSMLHCHWREFWSRDTNVYFTYIRFVIILSISRDRMIDDHSTPEILRFQPTSPFIFP